MNINKKYSTSLINLLTSSAGSSLRAVLIIVEGRLLARVAEVTLAGNAVVIPAP
jgi:hypothetical protein